MTSPNQGSQPSNAIILRGALQIEAALAGLELTGSNPELTLELCDTLEDARSLASTAEESGMGLNYTWFRKAEDGAERVRVDILEGLSKLAEERDLNPQIAELVVVARSLNQMLSAK